MIFAFIPTIMGYADHMIAGYSEINTPGEQGHEESKFDWHLDHNPVLCAMWMHRLCSIWKRRTRKFPHRVRLLRAILANRLCQRLHSRALSWGIPGKQLELSPFPSVFYGIDVYCINP